MHVFKGHKNIVNCLDVTDSDIFSGSWDNTIIRWSRSVCFNWQRIIKQLEWELGICVQGAHGRCPVFAVSGQFTVQRVHLSHHVRRLTFQVYGQINSCLGCGGSLMIKYR